MRLGCKIGSSCFSALNATGARAGMQTARSVLLPTLSLSRAVSSCKQNDRVAQASPFASCSPRLHRVAQASPAASCFLQDNIPEKVREAGEPLKQKLKEHLEPLKATVGKTAQNPQRFPLPVLPLFWLTTRALSHLLLIGSDVSQLSATSSSRTGDAFKAHETPEIFQKLKALYTR